jgi:hypothetical protein
MYWLAEPDEDFDGDEFRQWPSQSDGRGAAEFRGTATKSRQNFGAPRSRLEIPEWFGRPYLRPYSVVAL